jgi:hypothetical protein
VQAHRTPTAAAAAATAAAAAGVQRARSCQNWQVGGLLCVICTQLDVVQCTLTLCKVDSNWLLHCSCIHSPAVKQEPAFELHGELWGWFVRGLGPLHAASRLPVAAATFAFMSITSEHLCASIIDFLCYKWSCCCRCCWCMLVAGAALKNMLHGFPLSQDTAAPL